MPFVHCLECGKDFPVEPWVARTGRRKYCSRACHAKAVFTGMKRKPRTPEHAAKLGAAHIGKTPANKKPPVTIVCEICGKSFDVIPARTKKAHYCSLDCAHEAKRRVTGTAHKLFTRVEMACELCGKVVWVKQAKVHEFRFCSRRCLGTYISRMMAERKGPTPIEKAIQSELESRNIPYVAQKVIAWWLIDIALPQYRIAIECDGDYWHSSPEQQAKDARKDHWLAAHKWVMFRFTGTEIIKSPTVCVDKVARHVGLLTQQLELWCNDN